TNKVSTAYGSSTSFGQHTHKESSSSYVDEVMHSFFANQSNPTEVSYEDLTQVDKHDLEEMDLKWQMAMLSVRVNKFYKKTWMRLKFNEKEPFGFDKSKVECFKFHNMGHFARDCRSKGTQDSKRRDAGYNAYKEKEGGKKQAETKALAAVDGKSIDWNDHAKDDADDCAFTAQVEENFDDFALMAFTSDNKCFSNELISYIHPSRRSSDLDDIPLYDRFKKAKGNHAVPPPLTGIYMPPRSLSDVFIEEYELDNDDDYEIRPSKEQVTPSYAFVNTAKHVKIPREPVNVNNTYSQSPKVDKRDWNGRMSKTLGLGYSFTKKACFMCGSLVSAVRENRGTAIKASSGCNWRSKRHYWNKFSKYNGGSMENPPSALKDEGIVDSGCSRHMTGNKEHLDEYQDIKGGIVTFGGSKGRITGKGKIRTGKLDFENVYFVKELGHFNLFYVSQICDKRNRVLFTESECLVLSPDFKMPDESQVLLKIPRKQNMYNFNLGNLAPKRDLACLVAKATINKSNKWHRRQDFEIPQSPGPTLTFVADEATTTCVGVGTEGATTTTPSLDAGLDSGNIHESPLRSYDAPLPEGNTSGSAEDSLKLKELSELVPKLVMKIDKNQGRKIQDIDDDPLVSLARASMNESAADFITPFKVSALGKAQDKDISPTTMEAAKTLSQVASEGVSTYKRRRRSSDTGSDVNTDLDFFSTAKERIKTIELNTGSSLVKSGGAEISTGKEVNTGGTLVKSPSILQHGYRRKEKVQFRKKKRDGLEKAARLQAQMDVEVAKYIRMDKMVAKRMQEEEKLSEQQKKRRDEVQEAAKQIQQLKYHKHNKVVNRSILSYRNCPNCSFLLHISLLDALPD
ncbi:ribonuclease H-like domain-containing protein, partial [Tanacetum coccineum]